MKTIQTVQIGDKIIGNNMKPFIISEIGTNFNSLEEARKLVTLSARAGADAVKFQTYKAERLAVPGTTFPLKNSKSISQYDFFKKTELSEKAHRILKQDAEKNNILFISTPSSKEDVDFLDSLGVCAFKTGSDDLTNLMLLRFIAKKNKPIIVSTGMSTLNEIKKSLDTIFAAGNKKVILLHCTVGYPANIKDANLLAIKNMQEKFNVPIGYSDHTEGLIAPIVAASLGACLIEKHVAWDKSRGGPDNDVAIDIRQLKSLVNAVNKAHLALGSSKKEIVKSEEQWVKAARKSIFTAKHIKKGQKITEDMLNVKRAGAGIPASNIDSIIGKKVKKNIEPNKLLVYTDIS